MKTLECYVGKFKASKEQLYYLSYNDERVGGATITATSYRTLVEKLCKNISQSTKDLELSIAFNPIECLELIPPVQALSATELTDLCKEGIEKSGYHIAKRKYELKKI